MTRTTSWLFEVHVDRRWYELRGSPEPIPAPGRPRTVAIDEAEMHGRALLLGRGSPTRPVDIDLRPDTGVSRRHAELRLSDGHWTVVDLGSHNGTWLSTDALQMPGERLVAPARMVDGANLFLGSWTRILLRRGAPGGAGLG